MSKERELLGVALEFLDPKSWVEPEDVYAITILSSEIEELLAQPEQDNFDKLMHNCNARKEAIAELILCMRFSNKHDLAQAVLDYIEGLTRANREVGNE